MNDGKDLPELTASTVLKNKGGKVLAIQNEKIPGIPAGGSYLISINYVYSVASKRVVVYDKFPHRGGTVFAEMTVNYS